MSRTATMSGSARRLYLQPVRDFWQLDFEVYYSKGGTQCSCPFGTPGEKALIVRRGDRESDMEEDQDAEEVQENENGDANDADTSNDKFKMIFRVHKDPQGVLRPCLSVLPDRSSSSGQTT